MQPVNAFTPICTRPQTEMPNEVHVPNARPSNMLQSVDVLS